MRIALGLLTLATVAASAFAHSTEVARLAPADLGAGDRFGSAVAMSGHTAAVGVPFHDAAASNAGAVYVFVSDPFAAWSQQQKLTASGAAAEDGLGATVALDGDTLAAAAPLHDAGGSDAGAVVVFVRAGTVWTEQDVLWPGAVAPGDRVGSSLALSGDTLVVGVDRDDDGGADSGSAFVFVRTGTVWSEQAQLVAADADVGDLFGTSVALVGDTCFVGSPQDDDLGDESGSVYLFERSGTVWSESAKLVAPDGAVGDLFGWSVALTDDAGTLRAIVGAPEDDDNGPDSGSGHLFERTGTTWGYVTKHLSPGGKAGDGFGRTAAVEQHFSAYGAPFADPGGGGGGTSQREAGKVHSFEGPPATLEVGLLTPLTLVAGSEFGTSVSTDGFWILIGAPKENATGAVYLFWRVYVPTTYCTRGVSASGCLATMTLAGTASVTKPTGFFLVCGGVEGDKDGLFFYGANGRQANPWGNGTSVQCVAPPVLRAGLLQGTGTPGTCGGNFFQDMNAVWCATCPKPQKNPGIGAIVQAQLWYRDPQNTSNQTTSLSDAVEFQVGP